MALTLCSYQEFKYAKGLKKKIAHIKMCDAFCGGQGQAFVEMSLEGIIYKLEREGPGALVAWVLRALGVETSRGYDTLDVPPTLKNETELMTLAVVGAVMVYTKTNATCTILQVHYDDGGADPYYTIRLDDGSEKHTAAQHLGSTSPTQAAPAQYVCGCVSLQC